jgi:hypothetical protein
MNNGTTAPSMFAGLPNDLIINIVKQEHRRSMIEENKNNFTEVLKQVRQAKDNRDATESYLNAVFMPDGSEWWHNELELHERCCVWSWLYEEVDNSILTMW